MCVASCVLAIASRSVSSRFVLTKGEFFARMEEGIEPNQSSLQSCGGAGPARPPGAPSPRALRRRVPGALGGQGQDDARAVRPALRRRHDAAAHRRDLPVEHGRRLLGRAQLRVDARPPAAARAEPRAVSSESAGQGDRLECALNSESAGQRWGQCGYSKSQARWDFSRSGPSEMPSVQCDGPFAGLSLGDLPGDLTWVKPSTIFAFAGLRLGEVPGDLIRVKPSTIFAGKMNPGGIPSFSQPSSGFTNVPTQRLFAGEAMDLPDSAVRLVILVGLLMRRSRCRTTFPTRRPSCRASRWSTPAPRSPSTVPRHAGAGDRARADGLHLLGPPGTLRSPGGC